jgi:hypothetical protein
MARTDISLFEATLDALIASEKNFKRAVYIDEQETIQSTSFVNAIIGICVNNILIFIKTGLKAFYHFEKYVMLDN